jgi:hypothetical protein
VTRHRARAARSAKPSYRKANQPSEHSIQARFISGLQHIPHPAAQKCHYAIPNQAVGPRIQRQVRFGAEGCRWGASDWHMFYPTKQFHGFFIEFKRQGEKPRPNQVEFMELARSCGHRVEVHTSAESAWAAVCDYLGVAVPEALRQYG